MSDITVVATVTMNTPPATGFTWAYSVAGTGYAIPEQGVLQIPSGTSPNIMLNVVAGGQPNDICVFQNPAPGQEPQENPPLTFESGSAPLWFQGLQFLDASTILFTDDNTNSTTTSYDAFINVAYSTTTILDGVTTTTTVLTTSPDPTIMNVGTDGGVVIGPALVSRAQPQPAGRA
ncbi:MAG TPA: hypothetical protein VFR03_09030 [Thermoanaerobaculia bacterium]|nr:hypothetical protein [Thermoanaerobaculia bacterium]